MAHARQLTDTDAAHIAAHEGETAIMVIGYDPYKSSDEPLVVAEIRTQSTELGDPTNSYIKISTDGNHTGERTDAFSVTTPFAVDASWVGSFLLIHGYNFR